MDKINIVSSQTVHIMSTFSRDTRSMFSSLLVNSLVKNRLFKTAPDIDEPPFQWLKCHWTQGNAVPAPPFIEIQRSHTSNLIKSD